MTIIADIVAVNGLPAKGTYVGRTRPIVASPTPSAGGAVADITRTAMREQIFEIQKSDGTAVGTIMSAGFSGGTGHIRARGARWREQAGLPARRQWLRIPATGASTEDPTTGSSCTSFP